MASLKTYDYVVVGAGSAGCVVAARLSENPRVNVLLMEAGKSSRSIYMKMPAALAYPLSDERILWNYDTGPEPALNGRTIKHVRGRTMGGSSSINGMVFVRGNARDFDDWAAAGLSQWSYQECLPYFKKLEDFDQGATEFRGAGGPMRITTCSANGPIFEAFLEAGQQAGLSLNADYNARSQEGVHRYQATIDHGVRASASHAYLRGARGRNNLYVLEQCKAHSIVFDGKRAVGVRVRRHSGDEVYLADREVIVCGGTYESPRLLLLSGVGSKNELDAIGISCVADIPGVGKNLQDHPCVPVGWNSAIKGVSPATNLNPLKVAAIGAQWLFLRSGLGATNFWEVGSFFKSNDSVSYCDIQHEFIPMIGDFTHGSHELHDGFLYQTCLMRPKSRGSLTLASRDPSQSPAIVHNYLTERQDVRNLIDGVRSTLDMVHQRAWDRLRGLPLEPDLMHMDDKALAGWLRDNVSTQYHPCGTCRMGDDEMSVVDQVGLVHCIEGLRVVDASIMPQLTSGNLNAPTIMIAEKIADHMVDGR